MKLVFSLYVLLLASAILHCPIPTAANSDEIDVDDDEGRNATRSSAEIHNATDHRFFLSQLFHKYGHDGVMTFEGFEHLLANLGLGRLILDDHDLTIHRINGSFAEVHDTLKSPGHEHRHQSSTTSTTPTAATTHLDDDESGSQRKRRSVPREDAFVSSVERYESEVLDEDFGKSSPSQTCLTAPELLLTYGLEPYHSSISPINFLHLCPAIIYELDQRYCWQRKATAQHLPPVNMDEISSVVEAKVWLYATGSVIIISLCGLLGVAAVPLMQRLFYQHLIQFLVALAIGSLSGDALLHLLPHALSKSDHSPSNDHHDHRTVLGHNHSDGEHEHEHDSGVTAIEELHDSHSHSEVWKALATVIMILVFFIMEKVLQMIRNRKQAATLEKANKLENDDGYREEIIVMTTKEALAEKENGKGDDNNAEKTWLPMESWACPSTKTTESEEFQADNCRKNSLNRKPSIIREQGYTQLVLQDHQTDHKAHGHSHNHSHVAPDSVSAVAWMVILGDGLHNFSDGLAIGAGFAAGITTGLSTAFAVFCHELPHEIGDFAVLIKSGMSIKQGLLYNMLSSVLCFFGMSMGILLSQYHGSTSSWIFAGAAGTFLYISLVDLVPELNSYSNNGNNQFFNLFLQCCGMCLGGFIMLMMGVYEEKLKSLFDSW